MSESIADRLGAAPGEGSAPPLASDPSASNRRAVRFATTAVVIGLALFGLFRVGWVQSQVLIPYAEAQQRVAGWIAGFEKLPVVVSFACTGADVIALCLATVLAFPVPWRRRFAGAAVGLLLITVVNTMRIGSLSLAAGQEPLFQTLHVVVWPAILIVVVSVYVFLWMRWAGRSRASESGGAGPEVGAATGPTGSQALRFALWLVPLSVLYLATSNWYLNAEWVLTATRWTASVAAGLMSLLGAAPKVTGNVLATIHGSYKVTPICIATPLVPVYFAAALALPMARWKRAAFLLAGPLVFFALGVLRLLVLAVPKGLVPSYSDAIHAFNSLVFALLAIALAAIWRERTAGETRSGIFRRTGSALAVGGAAALAIGLPWTQILRATARGVLSAAGHSGHWLANSQGATSLLPAFQLGLFAALAWILVPAGGRSWRRIAWTGALLAATQLALYLALAELWSHGGFEPHVREQRAWMILLPMLLAWWASGRSVRSLLRGHPGGGEVSVARA